METLKELWTPEAPQRICLTTAFALQLTSTVERDGSQRSAAAVDDELYDNPTAHWCCRPVTKQPPHCSSPVTLVIWYSSGQWDTSEEVPHDSGAFGSWRRAYYGGFSQQRVVQYLFSDVGVVLAAHTATHQISFK